MDVFQAGLFCQSSLSIVLVLKDYSSSIHKYLLSFPLSQLQILISFGCEAVEPLVIKHDRTCITTEQKPDQMRFE